MTSEATNEAEHMTSEAERELRAPADPAAPLQPAEQAAPSDLDGTAAELAELKDRLLRALAEKENFRRRAERERDATRRSNSPQRMWSRICWRQRIIWRGRSRARRRSSACRTRRCKICSPGSPRRNASCTMLLSSTASQRSSRHRGNLRSRSSPGAVRGGGERISVGYDRRGHSSWLHLSPETAATDLGRRRG